MWRMRGKSSIAAVWPRRRGRDGRDDDDDDARDVQRET
jgi:hypothetical protein